jgi:rsbT co-antagonist protein RsbR
MEADKIYLKADPKTKAQILDQVPTSILAVDKDFKIIYMNQVALDLIDKPNDDVIGCCCYDIVHSSHCGTSFCCMKKAIETGKTYSDRAVVPVKNREVTVEYYAVPLKDQNDEIVGGWNLQSTLQDRCSTKKTSLSRAAPYSSCRPHTIRLWDGILVLPIVGVIDSMRAQSMMESMLNKIVETYSKVIILDIQGVAAVDTAVAQHLIKIAKATKLMGCECILSGSPPQLRRQLFSLGSTWIPLKQKPPSATRFRKRSIC